MEIQYKTEYQYLFSLLYKYSEDQKGLDAPLVANIARKVLEYFACFKWSCKTTEEFTNIVLTRYIKDENKFKQGVGDFVVKFLNENSHGQDFTRTVVASSFEAKDIAKMTMEFIKFEDYEHFNHLESKCRK
jgi:wobble nucleotide-excising tRNase